MANEMFTQYDKPRIAMLCEKAGLMQRALEHYENVDDLKRVMARTEMITPEFLVKCAAESLPLLASLPHPSRSPPPFAPRRCAISRPAPPRLTA